MRPRALQVHGAAAAARNLPENVVMSDHATIPATDILTVYGAEWCGDCRRTKRYLAQNDTPYTWIDTDAQPEQRELLRAAGYPAIPVVVVPGGAVLMEPSNATLAAALAAAAESKQAGADPA